MAVPRPPDLQEWLHRHGGYWCIPWHEWDALVAEYHSHRRAIGAREKPPLPEAS